MLYSQAAKHSIHKQFLCLAMSDLTSLISEITVPWVTNMDLGFLSLVPCFNLVLLSTLDLARVSHQMHCVSAPDYSAPQFSAAPLFTIHCSSQWLWNSSMMTQRILTISPSLGPLKHWPLKHKAWEWIGRSLIFFFLLPLKTTKTNTLRSLAHQLIRMIWQLPVGKHIYSSTQTQS